MRTSYEAPHYAVLSSLPPLPPSLSLIQKEMNTYPLIYIHWNDINILLKNPTWKCSKNELSKNCRMGCVARTIDALLGSAGTGSLNFLTKSSVWGIYYVHTQTHTLKMSTFFHLFLVRHINTISYIILYSFRAHFNIIFRSARWQLFEVTLLKQLLQILGPGGFWIRMCLPTVKVSVSRVI